MSASPPSEDARRAALKDSAKVVGIGLAAYAVVQVVAAVLAKNTTAAAAIQTVVAEFGAGRAAITWSDPLAPAPSGMEMFRRAWKGVALGFAAAMFLLVLLLLTRGALLAPNKPAIATALLGLLVSGLAAARDELLLRGVVLRAMRAWMGPAWLLVVCGAVAGAARMGVPFKTPLEIIGAMLGGVVFGAIWLRDRGAWMAWGAHTAWSWLTGSLIRGGALDVRLAPGVWGGGDAREIEGALAATLVIGAVAALAWRWAIHKDATATIP